MQFQIDNGLCVIDETKFETQDNIEIGIVKRVKYGTSYLNATLVGIGKYIVYLHINCMYNIAILLLHSYKGDKKTQSKIENNLLEQNKTNEKSVGKSSFPLLLYDLLQSQIQSQEDKPSKRKTSKKNKQWRKTHQKATKTKE